MKKINRKSTSWLLIVIMILGVFSPFNQIKANAITGAGTLVSPYLVSTPADLKLISTYKYGYFKLVNDVDMTGVTWTPVIEFLGTIDGNGFAVNNLKTSNFIYKMSSPSILKNITFNNIDLNSIDNGGLIADLNGGVVDNCVVNGMFKGTLYVGSIASQMRNYAVIKNSKSSGTVISTGIYSTGGIVGYMDRGSTLTNNEISAVVDAKSASPVGGIVGNVNNDNVYNTIKSQRFTGTVMGNNLVGGIVGQLQYANTALSDCSVFGNISGNDNVGGIAGKYQDGQGFSNDQFFGNIVGRDYVGGVVGYSKGNSVLNCLVLGSIRGRNNMGGFVGIEQSNYKSITNSYTSVDMIMLAGGTASLCKPLVGSESGTETYLSAYYDSSKTFVTADLTRAKSPALLRNKTTFASWDFTTIWNIDENTSFPYLKNLTAPQGIFKDVSGPALSLVQNITAKTNQDVVITASAIDTGGVKNIKTPDGNIVLGATATYTIGINGTYTFTSEDNSGNITIYSIVIENIDKTAPTLPVISIINDKLTITHGNDSNSGVKETLMKINDAEWIAYSGILTLVDGNYIIEAKTIDNVGNVSDSVLEIFDIYTQLQNNSSQSVDIAESTKSQADLDSARTITMNLPDSPERTALIARLDALQIEINYTAQVAVATTAVAMAELSKNQADVDSVRLLVDALRSVDKLSLTLRLDIIVTAPPTSVEVAVNLVVIAETAKTQIDINNSWDSVALVQDTTIRTSLQERIKVVDTVYKTAVSTLESATISRTRTNIVSADTKTKAMNVNIPDKVEMVTEVQVLKTEYNTNFTTIVNYDTIINQATYYVNTMEKSLSNFNATKAQSYIIQLPDGENKSRLQERLDLAKQRFAKTLTALQEATYWVDKAGITRLDYYINIAQLRVTKLVASIDKEALQIRINILK